MAVTFLRVAELGSFSRAAEQLGYSQAAVTVQMKQLERELGTQLFERIGRRIRLTEDGARFIPYAQELLKAARNARTFVQGARTPSGRLRIGTAESLSISVLPPGLLQFHRLCPLVETSLHTGLISELFDMVRQNHVDLLYFLGILFYARSNVAYLFGDNWVSQTLYKLLALAMLFVGGLAAYQFVWDLGDVGVGLMTVFNMIALFPLAPKALASLRDYETNAMRKK